MRGRRRSSRSGFTLIEIAIVVFIIGAIMMLVLPSVAKMFTPGAQEEAILLHDVVTFCYRRAKLNQRTIFLELNIDEEKYVVIEVERGEEGMKEKPIFQERDLPSSSSIVDIMDARGYRYVKGKVRIPFSPLSIAEDFYIHLGPDPEIKRTLIVRRYGGKSEIRDGEALIPQDELDWYKQNENNGTSQF
ncbi:prepilin-type cleavage/methylation N-terminal domain protein [Leptospira inadai serovar Lyme str. 10]|uniref:Prepilin-type cleavage/methylation N-terminal domain protein n=2 Tax=Leptospira inadai serovar Lyme TaxID=293084 RepID=V6HXA6_9LEPT|nr:type II secretion system protein [Leptospira inadai]EQA37634.1 prepilin-type cleavage/methylation N-terminal domain protein [Leptospira inadai serovar Lyme str. 10]PNV76313.1 prepilin-type cleavage/methylation domain-containing protein [Leptospira inadai serovar Lyme]